MLTIPTSYLRAALHHVSREGKRPGLWGVNIRAINRSVVISATNGTSAFISKIVRNDDQTYTFSVTIPTEFVKCVLALHKRAVTLDVNIAAQRIADMQYTPIDAQYPDINSIIPRSIDVTALRPARLDPALALAAHKSMVEISNDYHVYQRNDASTVYMHSSGNAMCLVMPRRTQDLPPFSWSF